MPTLNEEAYRIVRLKEPGIAVLPVFSIVFMGDSHVGMASCTALGLPRSIDQYERLLNEIKNRNTGGRTLAIIHGGDGTHVGENNLVRFIDSTVRILYPSTLTDLQKIPLFMNAGNHEYKVVQNGKIVEGVPAGYEKLVQAKILTQSNLPAKHPDVQVIPLTALNLRIVLLNTGYSNNGNFDKIDKNKFRREVTQLDRWMTNLRTSAPKVRFIIDMHIPPNIGRFGTKVPNPYGPPTKGGIHVLNDTYNALFTKYVLERHKDRIIGVVSHHRHCIPINNNEYPPQLTPLKYPTIDFFITPSGGHCNTACGGTCNPATCNSFLYEFPYHAIRINLGYDTSGSPRILNYDIIYI